MRAGNRRLYKALAGGLIAGVVAGLGSTGALARTALARAPESFASIVAIGLGTLAFIVSFVLVYFITGARSDAGASGPRRLGVRSTQEREIRDVEALVALCVRRAGGSRGRRRPAGGAARPEAEGKSRDDTPRPDGR